MAVKEKYKILHLEDVQADSELVVREIRASKIDFDYLLIDTEQDYIEALNNFHPDVILCDHTLPAFNSFEALRILKGHRLNIPFIVITATMTEDVALNIVREGADDYILKDRLKRLPYAVINAVEKFRFEKERKELIDNVHYRETLSDRSVRESEAKYRSFFESSMDGILLSDTDGNILSANPSACSIFGMTEEELCRDGKDTISDKSDPALAELLKQVRRNGNIRGELTLLRKNGKAFPAEISIQVIADSYGSQRISMILRDTTERNKSEVKLRESEERYRTMFEQNLAGFYQSTVDGKILNCNKAFARMLKYNSPEELLNINANELYFSSVERKSFTNNIINRKKLINYEGVLKCKDGSPMYFLENISIRADAVTGKEFFDGILIDITERKEADNKLIDTSRSLQNALNDLNKIMNSSLDIICSIDTEGRFVMVSAASDSVLGYTPEELKGEKYINLVYTEDVEKTKQVAEEILRGNPVTTFENRYCHKNGGIIPLLWSARWDETENLMYCIAKDATEKKRLEKAFEIESKRFSDLFFQAPSSIGVLKGPNHVFALANPLYLQLINKTNIIGKSVIEVLPEVADQGFIKILDEVYTTGVPYSANEMLLRLDQNGDGTLVDKYLNLIYQAYSNMEGVLEGIFFFAVDVTEQVLSRNKIVESNERFVNVSKATFDVVWDWDIKTKELFLGDGFKELFGYDLDQNNNFTAWSTHIHPEDMERVITNRLNKIIKHDESNWVDEYRYIRADETTAYIIDRGILLRNNSGTYRMIGAMQDVTQLKEKEISISNLNLSLEKRAEELSISNGELEQFAYVASHDLQEPLRMVTGFLSQLEKKYGNVLDEKGRQYIDFAVDGARRMRQIILDLLEFSRIGRINYSREKLNLNHVISDIKVLCRTQIEEKNAKIEVQNLPVIYSYSTSLRQVFQNLISNALKYSNKNDHVLITISAVELENHWQFTVADNGIGIAEEYFEKIFIIFQRLHNKEEYSGTGMGLALTKKIIETLGGKIWVDSQEHKGSNFHFTLLKQFA